jgi:glycosyltransferase involved in cell wall biosynthesis
MKMLFLINRVPWPLKDGGAIATYQHIRACADAGCDVTVLAFNTTKHFISALPEELIRNITWHTVNLDNRVTIWGALQAFIKNESYHASRFRNAAFATQLEQIIANLSLDVVVFESIFMAHYLPVVRKHTRATTVLRQHNVEWQIWSSLATQTHNPIKRLYLRVLAQQLKTFETAYLNAFDAIVPITHTDLHTFEKMGLAIPAHVHPVGVSVAALPPYQTDTPVLFHLGSMEWRPNQEAIHWFIEKVWPQVHQVLPTLTCYIAGRGLSATLFSNQPGIHIVGEVSDAAAFMHDKPIMVVPIFAGSGIRVKILEGMALGKAIVTTHMGIRGIAAQHNKHVLIADTPSEFAQAIIQLATQADMRKTIGKAAYIFACENYDLNKITAELLQFYTKQAQSK